MNPQANLGKPQQSLLSQALGQASFGSEVLLHLVLTGGWMSGVGGGQTQMSKEFLTTLSLNPNISLVNAQQTRHPGPSERGTGNLKPERPRQVPQYVAAGMMRSSRFFFEESVSRQL